MKYTWKISDIYANDGLITRAKYHCTLEDGLVVETEGVWNFLDPKLIVPFEEVTEETVANWIDAESKGAIVQNLQTQLQAQPQPVLAPWLPQIYTPPI